MPIGTKSFSINRHTHTKADTIVAVTTALDDLVTGDAAFAPIHDAAVAQVTSLVGLAADPLAGQEVYVTVYGTLDSWEAERPDDATGVQLHVQVVVSAEV